MKVKRAQIIALFQELKKFSEAKREYCLAPDKIPVSRDDIQFTITQLYGIKVEIFFFPRISERLRSVVEIYAKNAKIYIDIELNKFTTNYAFAKEACHIILVNADNCTEDPGQVIESLIQDAAAYPDGDETAPADVANEKLAEIGAAELLFPFELRAQCKAEIAAGTTSVFKLSNEYEVPEHIIEMCLSDWYMKLATEMWAEVR